VQKVCEHVTKVNTCGVGISDRQMIQFTTGGFISRTVELFREGE